MWLISKIKSLFKKEDDDDKLWENRFIANPIEYHNLKVANMERYKPVHRYLYCKIGHPVNKAIFYEIALALLFDTLQDEQDFYYLLKRFNLDG